MFRKLTKGAVLVAAAEASIFKRIRAEVVVAAVGLALAPAPNVLAGATFNNADLKGDYSWVTSWEAVGAGGAIAVGVLSADGNGLCTLLRVSPDPSPLPCSGYAVTAGGAVWVQGTLSGVSGSMLVLNNNNAGADGFETNNAGYPTYSVKLTKQSAPGSEFNNADLKGSYSWRGPALGSGGPNPDPNYFVSLFTADGAGNCVAFSAYYLQPLFTCGYTVQPNGVVTLSVNGATMMTFVLNNRGAGAVGITSVNGGMWIVTLTKE